jgi:hypothetical protein
VLATTRDIHHQQTHEEQRGPKSVEYNSTSPDGSFLRLLHRDNVGYDSPVDAIAAGHWVCLPANQRRPIDNIGDDVARANPKLPAHGAAVFVASAMTAYCGRELPGWVIPCASSSFRSLSIVD